MSRIEITPQSLNEGVSLRMNKTDQMYLRMSKGVFFLNFRAVFSLCLEEKDSVLVIYNATDKTLSIKKGKGFRTRKHPTVYKREHRFFSTKLYEMLVDFYKLKTTKNYVFPLRLSQSTVNHELKIHKPFPKEIRKYKKRIKNNQ
tara:strand:- start:3181 stop:3612 length:432 start_codon:yes stop_codon:yes gene_type:complete